MSTVAGGYDLRVADGCDTHKDVHVAVVLVELERLLDTASFAATVCGCVITSFYAPAFLPRERREDLVAPIIDHPSEP